MLKTVKPMKDFVKNENEFSRKKSTFFRNNRSKRVNCSKLSAYKYADINIEDFFNVDDE